MRDDTAVWSFSNGDAGPTLADAAGLTTGPVRNGVDTHAFYVASPTGGPAAGGVPAGEISVLLPFADDPGDNYAAQWLFDGVRFADGTTVAGLDGARATAVSPDGNFLYVLGSDSIAVFHRYAASGQLDSFVQVIDAATVPSYAAALAGASGLTISADGAWVEVLGATNGELARFSRDTTSGTLTPFQSLRNGNTNVNDNALASVTISPDGHWAYALAPHEGGLEVFGVSNGVVNAVPAEVLFDSETLTQAATNTPWPIAVTQTVGLYGASALAAIGDDVYVADPAEGTLSVFQRDPITGLLNFVQSISDGAGGAAGLAGVTSVAVSPDGKSVFAGGSENALAFFRRDPATGRLTYEARYTDASFGGIAGLSGIEGIAVGPDSRTVYVAGSTDAAVAAFAVGPYDLTYVNSVAQSAATPGLDGASAIAVSPDGLTVYVAGSADNALVVLSRNPATGALSYLQGLVNGAGGIIGLGAASAVAVSPVYADTDAHGNPASDQYVFVRRLRRRRDGGLLPRHHPRQPRLRQADLPAAAEQRRGGECRARLAELAGDPGAARSTSAAPRARASSAAAWRPTPSPRASRRRRTTA